MMSRPCACFTSMYIRNLLVAHASIMVWRFVCTSCHPSLTSYGVNHFLASHSLKPAPFGAGLLLGHGLFLLRPTPLFFFFFFFCSLCVSYRTTLPFLPWCYLTQTCWAFLGLLLILPSMTQYSHLSLFGYVGHPWPIYFPWALLALFLTLHSHGLY